MENDFKIFLTASFVIHATLFAAFGFHSKRSAYIVMPIDLLLNSPSQQENISKETKPQNPLADLIKKQKEKDILVPKKLKQKVKKQPLKKAEAEKSSEGKPQAAAPQENTQARASGFSGSISVDTAKFPYAYYTNLIVRKIGRYWQWSNEFGRLKSVVFFRIQQDGNVSEVSLEDPSGDRLFDEQALRAVKLAGPFPPLPEGYSDKDLGVFFEFSYRE